MHQPHFTQHDQRPRSAIASTAFSYPDFSGVEAMSDVRLQLQYLTNNTGNLLFLDSLDQFFDYGLRIDSAYFEADVVPPAAKTLVLSLANWISPAADMSQYAVAIEKSGVERVVVVGAGAQAQTFDEAIRLQPGTQRFLSLIAERSTTIGVRGEFTADVLAKLGVRNVDVIGCPSVFLIDPHASRPPLNGSPRLTVNTSWHGHYRDAIAEVLRYGRSHDALYVEQSHHGVMRLARDGALDASTQFLLRYYSDGNEEAWGLLEWLRRRATYFTSLERWRADMARVDLAIGSRFHGNLVAIIAGARGLLLTLDTRTREFADYFNLPQMRFDDFDARQPLEHYYELADPSLFLATFPDRKARFREFLVRNGLTPSGVFADPSPAPAHESAGDPGMARAERRLIDDARRIGLPEAELTAEQARRAAPLRGLEEGRAVERAEFALSRAERIGGAPRARLGWRARQRVRGDYVHRDAPTPQTKRSQNNQWRAYAYLNAKRIADAIGARKIVDFGCGTGSKLIETFGALDTLGIEIEPALGGLRRRMPDRVWLDGQILDPRAFDADLVICCDALEHQTEPDRLLSAMAASRAKAFILTTPALELLAERGAPRLGPPRDPTHVYEWTTSEFAELVGDHLHLVAHAIVDQRHAIQLCVAVRRDDPAALSALFPTNASADLICAPPHPKNGPQTRKRK